MNIKNKAIPGKHKKPILVDLSLNADKTKKPLAIFCHGYKGYKDWGAFKLMPKYFNDANIALLKFNFSHNGGTPEQPIDFPDLDAFGNNNFSIEQDDLDTVIEWICAQDELKDEIDFSKITLIGHSRGGGAVILKAATDPRISSLVTWAAVSDFKARFPEGPILEHWKKEGVAYIENARTGQQMPHYIQFYEDFIANEVNLTIHKAAKKINIPHLIIHGTDDTTVTITEGKNIHSWSKNSSMFVVNGAGHVFGAKQPWESTDLPEDFAKVVFATIEFIKQQ